jgi:elongation factor G
MIDVGNLRNVAILSHGGAGKTSLSEALLYTAKAITRLGNVQDGNTVSDYEPEEVRRAGSVQTALVPCSWKDCKINFLDTPGYDDFVGEVISAMRVVEGAIIVVAAPSGVEVGTERGWARCEAEGIPRLFFINKMDRENADFQRSLDSIRAQFGRSCVPFQVPIGSEQGFKGVVDLLNLPDNVPDEVADEVRGARERLVEAVAESDDDLATRYLEGEDLTPQEIAQGAKRAITSGALVPVLVGSASLNSGVEELLDAVVEYLPSPVDGRGAKAVNPSSGETESVEPDPDGSLAAFVFKTTADPFVGKLSLFRVYRGALRSNSEVWNQNKGQMERIGQVYTLRGKTQEQTPEVGPGDIGAIPKLAATVTGDTACQRDRPLAFVGIEFPVGYYTMSVSPKTKADVDKMSMSLARLVEEDPSLRWSREAETNETLVTGLGDTHVELAMERVHRKFGTELELQLPKVPYKETITAVARSEYKHKKQTGGHGQYGHVLLRVEPLERGQGFVFGEEVVGGSIPKEYIPSVEKGIVKTLAEGVVAGFPVVDVKAVLYDGSFHDVDSSGICFEIAGSFAIRRGVADAQPTLLEPIMKLSVRVPNAYNGEVMGDVNGKRGKIIGMVPEDGETLIEAEVPQAELLRYATDLRSMTQGRGSYSVEFSHYEGVPQHITQRVVEESKKA